MRRVSGDSRRLVGKLQRRHSCDEAALQGVRSTAPRHDAIRCLRKQLRTDDQRGPVPSGLESAKYVCPSVVAAYGRAQSPITVAKAPNALHRYVAGACGGDRCGIGQCDAGSRAIGGVRRSAAGNAHGDRGSTGCSAVAHLHGSVSVGSGCGTGANRLLLILTQSRGTRPLPRHPARHATKWMAGLLARGSVHLAAFPTCRRQTSVASGQALAAYSCGGSRGLVSAPVGARCVPHSLIALSLERGHQGA
jgi:hypothetical protein